MKLYTKVIKGCFFCPKRVESGTIEKMSGRCEMVISRNRNYKYIHPEETARYENGQIMALDQFPKWCPLEEVIE